MRSVWVKMCWIYSAPPERDSWGMNHHHEGHFNSFLPPHLKSWKLLLHNIWTALHLHPNEMQKKCYERKVFLSFITYNLDRISKKQINPIQYFTDSSKWCFLHILKKMLSFFYVKWSISSIKLHYVYFTRKKYFYDPKIGFKEKL